MKQQKVLSLRTTSLSSLSHTILNSRGYDTKFTLEQMQDFGLGMPQQITKQVWQYTEKQRVLINDEVSKLVGYIDELIKRRHDTIKQLHQNYKNYLQQKQAYQHYLQEKRKYQQGLRQSIPQQYPRPEYQQQNPNYALVIKEIPFHYDLESVVNKLKDHYAVLIEKIGGIFKYRHHAHGRRRNVRRIDDDILFSIIQACPTPLRQPFLNAIGLTSYRFAADHLDRVYGETNMDVHQILAVIWVDNELYKLKTKPALDRLKYLFDLFLYFNDPDYEKYKQTIKIMILACMWYMRHTLRVEFDQSTKQQLKRGLGHLQKQQERLVF